MRVRLAKVTAKGQVTIPREVRDVLGIKPGDYVAFLIRGSEVVLKKAKVEIEGDAE